MCMHALRLSSNTIILGKSDTIGRYMAAKRDIKPDEVIFTDQPAVIGPDNAAVPMCLVCWRSGMCAMPVTNQVSFFILLLI